MNTKQHQDTRSEISPEIRLNPPKLLNPAEAAFVLGISRRHLQNLTAVGRLPQIKLGKRVLYRWSRIEAALERLERELAS